MSGINQDELIDGRYRVQRRLGTGGMADVHLAEDEQLERPVALKLLHRRFAEDPGFVERFRREAQAAASLQHPNIVAVYDRGSWDGTYYIAMEYLRGRTLKQVVRDEAPLEPVRAIDIVVQILKATRFAHRRGVIHRDLKPHNVMLDEQDHAKVADFGIARAGASDMTETGSIMGTAQYLSPEQAQGLAVAEGSDLYSIGVVLYELLTGHVPFDAESAVTIALKHVSEAPVPPRHWNPRIPAALEQTILWSLNKDPADRPEDADAFINVLEAVRESLVSGGGAGVTAAMAALGPEAVAGGLGTAGVTGPLPRVQLGANPLSPSNTMHPVSRESGVLAPAAPVVPPPADPGRRRSRSGWARVWPWLLALLLGLAIAGGAVAFILTRPTKAVVPVVVNLGQETASTDISAAGFTAQVNQQPSSLPTGQVIYQSPLGGTRLRSGSVVTLTVSSGPGQTTVPAVVQLSESQAIRALHRAGLKVSRVLDEASTSVPKNQATRTDPDAGNPLKTGNSVVLYISSGVAPVPVPTVIQDQVATAKAALQGFNVTINPQMSANAQPGTVLGQTPAGGTNALPGSMVTLTVAQKEPSVSVPNLVGETSGQAQATLVGLGLKYSRSYEPTTTQGQGGQVLAQNPTENAKATQGSTVSLTIGRYSGTGTGTGTGTDTSTTSSSTDSLTIPSTVSTPATTTATTGAVSNPNTTTGVS